jgi:hypothetical protein
MAKAPPATAGRPSIAARSGPPAVTEPRLRYDLAHGQPAEQRRLDDQCFRTLGEVYLEPTGEAGAVVDDGFLRQPGDARAFRCRQPDRGAGLAGAGAVELFARLGGHGDRRAGPGLDLPGDAVAAGQAARRVDQDRFQRIGLHLRHADLGGALLIKPPDAGEAARLAHGKARPRIDALRRKLSHLAGGHQHRAILCGPDPFAGPILLPASSATGGRLSRTSLIASGRGAFYRGQAPR